MGTFDITGITNLGTITDEKNQIVNNIVQKSLPLKSTSGAIMSNVLGKKRTISVSGVNIGTGYSGADVDAKINNFIQDVEDWVNIAGKQERRIVTDSFGNTYDCICQSFTWDKTQNNPTFLLYTMVLIEGDFG
jgi:hypothetical protein